MRQQRSHKYIWISGAIASAVYVILSIFLFDDYQAVDMIVQFIVFYFVWVGIQYLLFKKKSKED